MSEETKNEIVSAGKNLALSKPLPMGEEAENIIKWSSLMSETKFYQSMVAAGGKNAILAIFLTARSLDIDPMLAINGGISCIQGRTMLSSSLMNMLIRRQGHSIQKKIGNSEIVHLIGKRRDNGDTMESIFTMKMAENAGLTKNAVYAKFPERMLFNRALSNLAKDLFPDCIGNSLCEGEIIDITPEVKEEKVALSREEIEFIETYNLNDLDSEASKLIEGISKNMDKSRLEVISICAKDPKRFKDGLDKIKNKNDNPKT